MGYIYWITFAYPIECNAVKIGFWSSSLQKLRSRYITSYGRRMELIVFDCESDELRRVESEVHRCMRPFHMSFFSYGWLRLALSETNAACTEAFVSAQG